MVIADGGVKNINVKKRTGLLLVILVGFFLVGHFAATLFKVNAEKFVVSEIMNLQREWYSKEELPDKFLIAHYQQNEFGFKLVSLWNDTYFAAWKVENGSYEELTLEEWQITTKKMKRFIGNLHSFQIPHLINSLVIFNYWWHYKVLNLGDFLLIIQIVLEQLFGLWIMENNLGNLRE
jgi:hypothetical protein